MLKELIKNTTDKEIKERVSDWFNARVDISKMDANVSGIVNYAKELDEPNEDGQFTAWAGEIVGSSYGQFIQLAFLNDVLGWEDGDIMSFDDQQEEFQEKYLLDHVLDLMDEIVEQIENKLNTASSLKGRYFIGYHEADGSLGIIYTEGGW